MDISVPRCGECGRDAHGDERVLPLRRTDGGLQDAGVLRLVADIGVRRRDDHHPVPADRFEAHGGIPDARRRVARGRLPQNVRRRDPARRDGRNLLRLRAVGDDVDVLRRRHAREPRDGLVDHHVLPAQIQKLFGGLPSRKRPEPRSAPSRHNNAEYFHTDSNSAFTLRTNASNVNNSRTRRAAFSPYARRSASSAESFPIAAAYASTLRFSASSPVTPFKET